MSGRQCRLLRALRNKAARHAAQLTTFEEQQQQKMAEMDAQSRQVEGLKQKQEMLCTQMNETQELISSEESQTVEEVSAKEQQQVKSRAKKLLGLFKNLIEDNQAHYVHVDEFIATRADGDFAKESQQEKKTSIRRNVQAARRNLFESVAHFLGAYEAYACDDADSIHYDFESQLESLEDVVLFLSRANWLVPPPSAPSPPAKDAEEAEEEERKIYVVRVHNSGCTDLNDGSDYVVIGSDAEASQEIVKDVKNNRRSVSFMNKLEFYDHTATIAYDGLRGIRAQVENIDAFMEHAWHFSKNAGNALDRTLWHEVHALVFSLLNRSAFEVIDQVTKEAMEDEDAGYALNIYLTIEDRIKNRERQFNKKRKI